MKKIFKTVEVLGIVSYFNTLNKEIANDIPLKTRWMLKKNLDKLIPAAQSFEEFRDEQIKDLQAKWFDEAHSFEVTRPKVDENGKAVMKNGVQETETLKQVKAEFIDDYSREIDELNEKLEEIAKETNEYDISTINMDEFVNNLPDKTKIDFDTITMLSFMDEETNIVK